MTEMPAISLWQPYASLIAIGEKQFETRHWDAPYRLLGRKVAIHAAARKLTKNELEEMYDDDRFADAFGFCHWHLRIPYGAVVATAILSSSKKIQNTTDDGMVILDGGSVIPNDGFGDYTPGRFVWRMTHVVRFLEPIAAKGHQGWWVWRT